MTVLMLVSSAGAVEGSVVTAYRQAGRELLVFDVKKLCFLGAHAPQAPTWLEIGGGSRSVLTTRYFERLFSDHRIDVVLAVGLSAGAYAAQALGGTAYISMLARGELDFSARRTGHVNQFRAIQRSAKALVLENAWEMDKAAAHGSRLPHAQWPRAAAKSERILNRGLSEARVAVVGAEGSRGDGERVAVLMKEVHQSIDATFLPIEGLYSTRDLESGRGLAGTMRYRLGAFSHVVLLGNSREMDSIALALNGDADRVVMEATIGNKMLASSINLPEESVGSQASLVARMWSLISGRVAMNGSIVVEPSGRLSDRMDQLTTDDLPEWYEELWPGLGTSGQDFNVFATVAPIEDRSNGARPQRIRNFSDALRESSRCVVVTSNERLLERRQKLVSALVQGGSIPVLVYGENSTAPMARYDVMEDFARLLVSLGQLGARVGWFVRDLHWLSKEAQHGRSDRDLASVVARGLHELEEIESAGGVLFAPNGESGAEFNRLLIEAGSRARAWVPLPPALAAANCFEPVEGEAGTTLVYSGGIGHIYSMDDYISALSYVIDDPRLKADFVIRPEDEEGLRSSLAKVHLADHPSIRIFAGELSSYMPVTRNAVGIVLLESGYGASAFPYKTVSMLERGFPVVCYSDMAIAEFVRSRGVGVTVPRGVGDLVSALLALASKPISVDTVSLLESDSWRSRMDQMGQSLLSGYAQL